MDKTGDSFQLDAASRQNPCAGCGGLPALPAQPVGGGAGFAEWFDSLPTMAAGRDLRELVAAIVAARAAHRPVHLSLGAPVVEAGVGPVLADLVERGIVTAVSVNGEYLWRELALAAAGFTGSPAAADRDIGAALAAMLEAAQQDDGGLGRAATTYLGTQSLSYARYSVLASCHRYRVPVTVHGAPPQSDSVAIPSAVAARDFARLTELAGESAGGAHLNIGDPVGLPKVFRRALDAARRAGREARGLICADLESAAPSRPPDDPGPTAAGGREIRLIGHHEILVPLLAAALVHRLWDPAEDE
ncbi:MAG: hypothetical protein GX444_14805 [Myxococcales bacterium]|nr:hypothetical protein [Myxococcales bacterium]